MTNSAIVEESVKRGDEFRKNRKHKDALECYRKAVNLDPKNAYVWNGIGAALYNLRKYDEALEAFEKTIEINPTHAEAWYRKGAALDNISPENSKKALEAYEKAVEFFGKPDNAEAWYRKAVALDSISPENSEKALEAYEKAVEFFGEPDNAEAWYILGNSLCSLGRYKAALSAYEEAIKINPNDSDIWSHKGIVLQDLKDYEAALSAYEEATKLDPRDEYAWNNKGVMLYYLERYKDALSAYEEAVKLDPKNAIIWNGKGAALYGLGKYEEAQKAYEKAIKLNKKYASPHTNLGELFLAHGDLGSASNHVDRAYDMNKENPFTLLMKGRIEIENEKYDNAIEFFEKAAGFRLGNPISLFWIAYTKYLKAEFSSIENKKYNEDSTDKKTDKPSIENKKYSKEIFAAIRDLEKARDISAKHPNRELRECILYFLGYFYYKTNDVFTAKERLEECIRLESRRVKVWEALISGSVGNELSRFVYSTSGKEKLEKIKRFVTAKSTTERRARELLNHIWKYKLKPAWWRRWWSSPVHQWSKRAILVFLLFPILSFLFYLLMPESVYISRENLLVYILLPTSILSIKENLDVYVAMISISIFFLLLPTIEKIKVKEINVEMSSLPSFEPFVSPSVIEEKIKKI